MAKIINVTYGGNLVRVSAGEDGQFRLVIGMQGFNGGYGETLAFIDDLAEQLHDIHYEMGRGYGVFGDIIRQMEEHEEAKAEEAESA